MGLNRISTRVLTVIVPDAAVVKYPAKEVVRMTRLASLKHTDMLRRYAGGCVAAALDVPSPSKMLASATRKMALNAPSASMFRGNAIGSPIRKPRGAITASIMALAPPPTIRAFSSLSSSRPLPAGALLLPTLAAGPLMQPRAKVMPMLVPRPGMMVAPLVPRARLQSARELSILVPLAVAQSAGARALARR